MANSPAIFSSLKGKKITLQGKFDRFERPSIEEMIQLQQGKLVDDLDKSVDYLVVAEMSSGMPAQKKAQSLNSKGANIQILDIAGLDKVASPTEQNIIQIIRMGKGAAGLLNTAMVRPMYRYNGTGSPPFTITGENFDGLDLSGMAFRGIYFDRCSFVKIVGEKTTFPSALNCNFTQANLNESQLWKVTESKFCNSNLSVCNFGQFDGVDFTGATMSKCTFVANTPMFARGTPAKSTSAPAIFKRAVLTESAFRGPTMIGGNFDESDLQSVEFFYTHMRSASFRQANLQSAGFFSSHLADADFSNANVRDAIFEDTDVTGARFDGADLAGADFNSAKTDRVDFSKAKNYTAGSLTSGTVGPALTELESLIAQAKRIDFEFKVQRKDGADLEAAGIRSNGLKFGWGVIAPGGFPPMYRRQSSLTPAATMVQLAARLRGWKVHYETLEVSSTKSPKSGKELREIVLNAISEAFAQSLPPAEELAKATKEWRDGINKATSKEREARKLAKEKEEKSKAAEKKKLAKKIEKEVGKVTDVATFLKALELRVDVEKIKKATKMLRAERFQLFNDVTDAHLNGVVKSQTDADLVYACRIEADGKYACCTQNLNICGGLRGSVCKHLLVLIIGLVQAGKLDPQTIDEWVAKSLDVKAELNKETMGEIFIRYKGAEAGEVDWRPTETMPEDYYAL